MLGGHDVAGLAELRSASTVSFFESTAVPEYALAFADDTLLLGAYDEHMRTHSVLRTTADSTLVDWARAQYETVLETATPVG